jgi:ATP-binding cassette subfamily B protein
VDSLANTRRRARACVRAPSILILDEATSAVDAESKVLIYKVLKEFSEIRTIFVITQVISQTFPAVIDRVVVINRGRMLANGIHPDASRVFQPDSATKEAA